MRKRVINTGRSDTSQGESKWLNLEELAEVEVSSEDPERPIECALIENFSGGWRASAPGAQTIRLRFTEPLRIQRIRLLFVESEKERTQEYLLRWSSDNGETLHEIVRQQWNFSSPGSTQECEEHRVELTGVCLLELNIIPDITGGEAFASMMQLRLA